MRSLIKYANLTDKICNHKILYKKNSNTDYCSASSSDFSELIISILQMEQKALKIPFSNTFSTKAVFSSNLKLNKVTNVLTNVSLRSSGGLKLSKRNACCLDNEPAYIS